MGCMLGVVILYKFEITIFLCGDPLIPQSPRVRATKDNLQRLINAFEGRGGPDYKTKRGVGNPCFGMPGAGMLKDLKDHEVVRIFGRGATQRAYELVKRANVAAVKIVADPDATLGDAKSTLREIRPLLQRALAALDSVKGAK